MRIGRLILATALMSALALIVPAPGSGGSGIGVPGVKEAAAGKAKKKRRKRRRGKSMFSGHGVRKEDLRTEPLPRPSGDLWVYAQNFREELRVNIYGDSTTPGTYDEESLAKLDRLFRCKRTGVYRAVDPRLYEILSIIGDHYPGKRIEIVSGFRFQENEGSRHFHASAVDFRIDGVSNRELYELAESLDTGGMGIGIYPRSGFVHVDFRAPGEPSYRWVDRSGPDKKSKGKRPSRRWRSRQPNT